MKRRLKRIKLLDTGQRNEVFAIRVQLPSYEYLPIVSINKKKHKLKKQND